MKQNSVGSLLFIFFVICLVSTLSAETAGGSYAVTFNENDPVRIEIKARIPLTANRKLFMAGWGADNLPEGWMSNIGNLTAVDAKNQSIVLTHVSKEGWIVGGNLDEVNLSYTVDVSFAKTKWPYGNEQAGFYDGSALFIVSKSLFVVSDVAGEREVKFNLPSGWQVSCPWRPTPQGFVASDQGDLIDNSLVVGKYAKDTFKEGNFDVTIAMLGKAAGAKDLVGPTLKKVLQWDIGLFPNTTPGQYLMTIFYADKPDAEAFARSAAFSERDEIASDGIIRWGNTVAHELFHSWNGHAMQSSELEATQWFSEGFTEYFTNLALVQQNLILHELFISKMEKNLGLYAWFNSSPAFGDVPIKTAGTKKGMYRLGVYNGGWTAAFCLDVMIRTHSKSQHNLGTVMQTLYSKYALTGKKFSYDELKQEFVHWLGPVTNEFFARYIEGTERMPLKECLHSIGFNIHSQYYDGEVYIQEDPAASTEARDLQRSILANSFAVKAGE